MKKKKNLICRCFKLLIIFIISAQNIFACDDDYMLELQFEGEIVPQEIEEFRYWEIPKPFKEFKECIESVKLSDVFYIV